jgi:hypothetical protein
MIPSTTVSAIKMIKGYFTLFNQKIERKIRTKKAIRRFRRLSSNKIYISNGEFKHTNNKVIINLYLFNRQKHNYILALKKLYLKKIFNLKTPKVHNPVFYKNIKTNKFNTFITNKSKLKKNKSKFIEEKNKLNKIRDKYELKNFKYVLNLLKKIKAKSKNLIFGLQINEKKAVLNMRYIFKFRNSKFNKYELNKLKSIRLNNHKLRSMLYSLGKNKRQRKINMYKAILLKYINMSKFIDKEYRIKKNNIAKYSNFNKNFLRKIKLINKKGLLLLRLMNENKYLIIKTLKQSKNKKINIYISNYIINFYKNFIKKSLRKLQLYLYYKQLIYINKSKYNYTYLQYLSKHLYSLYNKNIEYNLINLKRFYLHSDILSESMTLKLANKRRSMFKYLNRLKQKVKIKRKNFFLDKKILNNNLDCKKNPMISNSLENNVIDRLKYKHTSGFRLEAKGRLTKRHKAARSVSKVKYKGNLLNIDCSYKGLSTILLKGNLRSNLQYTKLKSKSRIGSFGIKGWLSGN